MFLYPPRPEKAIAPSVIQFYENRGWICQLKKNGTATVASIDAEGHVEWFTRHGECHKAWAPTDEANQFFSNYPNSVFVMELLHNKHASVKNTLYIFDVLVFSGRDLMGTTLIERLAILNTLGPLPEKILVAKVYRKGLKELYDSLNDPIDEGIVLKNPKAKLRNCQRNGLNSGWSVKCRVGTKNYGF